MLTYSVPRTHISQMLEGVGSIHGWGSEFSHNYVVPTFGLVVGGFLRVLRFALLKKSLCDLAEHNLALKAELRMQCWDS